jgi:hypothetical protein
MAYKMPDGDEAASAARTRAAFAERNLALNDLRDAKLTEASLRHKNLETRAEAEQAAAAHALEVGDWSDHALRQRNMSELAVQRARVEDEHRYWQNQPVRPHDPVEALIQSKASEPETVAWLRSHPADAVVLATGSSLARVAQIQSSHAAAVAAGHAPGSSEYFRHIDRALGSKTMSGSDNEGGKRVVRVVKQRQPAAGENELSPGEYKAATETVCWGNDAPPGKRGEPVGVEEYLRRRALMRKDAGTWYDRLD